MLPLLLVRGGACRCTCGTLLTQLLLVLWAGCAHVPLRCRRLHSATPATLPLALLYPTLRRATDHARWFETNISYRIPYEEGFEPYVLVQVRMQQLCVGRPCEPQLGTACTPDCVWHAGLLLSTWALLVSMP